MKCTNCGKELSDAAKFCDGCGSKIEQSDNRKVELKVVRDKSVLGIAIPFPTVVDDVEIGSLKNGKELCCMVPYGKHKVVFKAVEKNTEQELDIPENISKVEIHIKAKMGLLAATAKIVDVKMN